MKEHFDKTAILIFSRTAKVEARYKKILTPTDPYTHLDLYSDLLEHTKDVVRKCGLPFFHIDEQQQQGNSFGQKLTNAFRLVFEKGYEQVIAIGNDCPQITEDLLLKAANQFDKNKVVLGPASDGGDYLIGMDKDTFDTELLAELPWQTQELHKHFKIECEKNGCSVVELEFLSDLDTQDDLHTYIRELPGIFKRLSSSLSNRSKRPDLKHSSDIHSSDVIVQLFSSRAPPVC